MIGWRDNVHIIVLSFTYKASPLQPAVHTKVHSQKNTVVYTKTECD